MGQICKFEPVKTPPAILKMPCPANAGIQDLDFHIAMGGQALQNQRLRPSFSRIAQLFLAKAKGDVRMTVAVERVTF